MTDLFDYTYSFLRVSNKTKAEKWRGFSEVIVFQSQNAPSADYHDDYSVPHKKLLKADNTCRPWLIKNTDVNYGAGLEIYKARFI